MHKWVQAFKYSRYISYIGLQGQDEVKQVWYRGGYSPSMSGLKISMYIRKIMYTSGLCGLFMMVRRRFRGAEIWISQFMWSMNHNISNTDAHYSVHREERLLLSNWKGSVSWCTHSDNQSLRDGSKAFEEIKKVYIGKSQLWPFISHYVTTSIAMLILSTNEGSLPSPF